MFSLVASRLQGLRARYAEPHRAYHAQAHVDAMLAGLEALGPAVREPAVAELAIWYHDAVYDPARHDNEARSAALLHADMAGLADPAMTQAAALIVAATASHDLPPGLADATCEDCALILDLDMAVLGAPAPEYDAYEQGIAAEYVPVHGAPAFRAGRAAFLRRTLDRPALFHTNLFRQALDAPARGNMRRALATLEL